MKRVVIGLTAAALAAAVGLLGGAFREPEAGAVELPAFRAEAAASVEELQSRLRVDPDDADALALLGLAYQQRARETGDPAWLVRSEGVLLRARSVAPGHPVAVSGLGSLALAQHRFRDALAFGRAAEATDPGSARHAGVVVDALVELGRYREAFAELDRLAARKPGLTAYARVAYARELLGRPRDAIESMSLALDASGGRREPAAWTLVELGKLRFGIGELARARMLFRAALAAQPGYVYALDWLARVEAASGRYRRAAALAQRAVDTVPLPQFVATLADIHRSAGNLAAAQEQYALVGAIERLLRASGVNSDLEIALFRADHGIRPAETLALARRARAGRPSIYGDDVLAWALARNGRCREALPFSKRSLRLGTRDASLYFHRGMIERCLGRDGEAGRWFARALETNPSFSLIWADTARRYAS